MNQSPFTNGLHSLLTDVNPTQFLNDQAWGTIRLVHPRKQEVGAEYVKETKMLRIWSGKRVCVCLTVVVYVSYCDTLSSTNTNK